MSNAQTNNSLNARLLVEVAELRKENAMLLSENAKLKQDMEENVCLAQGQNLGAREK